MKNQVFATFSSLVLLTAAVAFAQGAAAQQKPVKMTFSGTGGPSAMNLQYPNTTPAKIVLPGTVR